MKRNIALGINEINNHEASTEDISILFDAAKALSHVGLCSDEDVLYFADILNTLILIDSFSASSGSDSMLGAILKKAIVS